MQKRPAKFRFCGAFWFVAPSSIALPNLNNTIAQAGLASTSNHRLSLPTQIGSGRKSRLCSLHAMKRFHVPIARCRAACNSSASIPSARNQSSPARTCGKPSVVSIAEGRARARRCGASNLGRNSKIYIARANRNSEPKLLAPVDARIAQLSPSWGR